VLSELAARWPAFFDALHSALTQTPLSRRHPVAGRRRLRVGSVQAAGASCRRYASYGLGCNGTEQTILLPFGPAVKKNVSGAK